MKDVMSSAMRKAQHEAGLKRISKYGSKITRVKACISVSPVVLKALHRKAASYGRTFSGFLVEAGSHYTPADGITKKGE